MSTENKLKVKDHERIIWNAAVRVTLNEVYKYDGLIPYVEDRKNMCGEIFKKIGYQVKKDKKNPIVH